MARSQQIVRDDTKPTKNRHVEPQLLKRFINDTINLQLLTVRETSDVVCQEFGPVVKDFAYSFTACQHLDTQLSDHPSSHIIFQHLSTLSVSFKHMKLAR